MGVIDDVHQVPALWEECSDLSIIPPRDNTTPIIRKPNAEAFQVWYLDPQQLLSITSVPYSNVVYRTGGKQLTVAIGERNVIDPLVVAGVA
jgi:hypothetical protein